MLKKISENIEPQHRASTKVVVNALLNEVIKICQSGDEVSLIGFGKFYPRVNPNISLERLNRNNAGINPYKLEFRPSSSAIKRLNGGLSKVVTKAATDARARKARKSHR